MKPRTMVLAAIAAIAAVGAAVLAYSRFAPAVPGAVLRPDDALVTARGEPLYRQHCAACHGSRLEGQPNWRERRADGLLPAPPHDASGHTWHHPDDVLFRITKFGVAKVANTADYATAMPVYEGVLSDDEIVAVLSWIKAQWPPDIRARHDRVNRQHLQAADS